MSSSTVQETTSGVQRVVFTKESIEKDERHKTFSGKISSKHLTIVHSIPNLCREVLWREPQKPEPFLPDLQHGKQLVWRMLLECFCTELLFYTIL
ncbi:hypothetical protein LOAG_14087 [Loa loa]|nr:hypothetical protein LOAG_14087 [Loa loa]EFO14433.1 hypothetical protein LOAG_14087 [Loa loa]